MVSLFNNFARNAQDFNHLKPGETLLVGMPGSILSEHVYFYSDISYDTGLVTLRELSNMTDETLSGLTRHFLGKDLTRPQDERFILKAGPVHEHDAYIMTFMDWGEKFRPYDYGYYNIFDTLQALDIIAEGFGPDHFLVMRGSLQIAISEMKNLLDNNIAVAIDAAPDIVFSRHIYETALESATYISMNDAIFRGRLPGLDFDA